MNTSSIHTVALWQKRDGGFTTNRRFGDIRRIRDVTGYDCLGRGGVQAEVPFQAAGVVGSNTWRTPEQVDGQEVGIVWRRAGDPRLSEGPPPLKADMGPEYWAVISFCEVLRIVLFEDADGAKDFMRDLDREGCQHLGEDDFPSFVGDKYLWDEDLPCRGLHWLTEGLTQAEARAWNPFWLKVVRAYDSLP